MKEISEYKGDRLNKLKAWLTDLHRQGKSKYFEILVDGVKVIQKTNDMEEFDRYLSWMDENSQSMRVLIYNTKNSHRSEVFMYTTDHYVAGVSDLLYPTRKPRLSEDEINTRVNMQLEEKIRKQAQQDTQKKIKELTHQLADAEEYIDHLREELEKNKEPKNSFDISGLLSSLAGLASSNPQAKDNLDGLTNIFNSQKKETKASQDKSEPLCTFRRKMPPEESQQDSNDEYSFREKINNECEIKETVEFPIKSDSALNKTDSKEEYTFTTEGNLDYEQAQKMYKLMEFFSEYPQYIDDVFDLVNKEKDKSAA